MRTATALCFLAVLCTVYAHTLQKDYLDQTESEIRAAIWTVEGIIQNIHRVRADSKQDTVLTVARIQLEQMNNHSEYVTLLLQSMRREVNDAKLRGVDAKECYDTNSRAIDKHSDTAHKNAAKCQENAETSIKNSLGFLDSFVSVGHELLNQLNNIYVNCHDDDESTKQRCIREEFAKINKDVEQFEENANLENIKKSVLPTFNDIVLKVINCLNDVYWEARFESYNAMKSNSRCVRKAVEEKDKGSFELDGH